MSPSRLQGPVHALLQAVISHRTHLAMRQTSFHPEVSQAGPQMISEARLLVYRPAVQLQQVYEGGRGRAVYLYHRQGLQGIHHPARCGYHEHLQ